MKLNKSDKTGDYLYELELFIEPEEFKEAISKVFKREGKKYAIPGFRKGKAPRNLIEKMAGEDVFFDGAINELFPKAYEEQVKALGLEPVDRPAAEVVSASQKDGVILNVKITVKPEVNVGKYTGLEAVKYVEEVDEKAVDFEINQMRERNARILTREGAAEDGDNANIDFEGFVDGVAFDGGKDGNFKLTLGSGQFIPGFEEQVVGHKAGDEFDVNVTFPEDYHAESLAGKEAVFKVKLNEVQYKEQPELDDEFAKDVSEYDTLDELKKSIRDRLAKEKDEKFEVEAENNLVRQIAETIEGEIPEAMYERRIDEMIQDFNFRLEQQGLNLQTYLQYSGMDINTFREGFREGAVDQVRMRLALEAVARLENIEAAEEDIDAEIKLIADKYQMEEEKVRELMPSEEIAKDVRVNKAVKFIKSKSKIKEEKVEDAQKAAAEADEKGEEKPKPSKKKTTEKAAKKPAAKKTTKKAEKTEDFAE